MKIIRIIAWASLAIGALLILGTIYMFCFGNICSLNHSKLLWFMAANSFTLLAIALFIASKQCCCDKCSCEDEKKEG